LSFSPGSDLGRLYPGKGPKLFPTSAGLVGPVICNEILYPRYVRRFVRRGADFLVNLANGGWLWCDTPRRQHFYAAVFRAVESGRDVVVSNNSGISGTIDAAGRITVRTPTRQPRLAVGEVYRRKDSTFYTRHGDLAAHVCIGVAILSLVTGILCPVLSSRPARSGG
jgi:apolipoprotein N-acyltransferase